MNIGSVIVTTKEYSSMRDLIPAGAYGVVTNMIGDLCRVSIDLRPFKIKHPEIVLKMLRDEDKQYKSFISMAIPVDYLAEVETPIEFDEDFSKFIWTFDGLRKAVNEMGFKYLFEDEEQS